jgi:hypothetical protein
LETFGLGEANVFKKRQFLPFQIVEKSRTFFLDGMISKTFKKGNLGNKLDLKNAKSLIA